MNTDLLTLSELLELAQDTSSNYPRIAVINLIKRCQAVESDNETLRSAIRNNSYANADTQRRLLDAANKCAELQAKLDAAEKEKSDALLESGKFWSEKYNHKLDEVIEIHSKLYEMEKQEPVSYLYSDMTGWKQPFLERQTFSSTKGIDFETCETPLYAKPIPVPVQQNNCKMGVGNGHGNLFVHGDYESIKAAQAIVLERDSIKEENKELTERLRCACEKIEKLNADIAELRMQYISDFGQEQYNDENHERDTAIRKDSFHRFNNSGFPDAN